MLDLKIEKKDGRARTGTMTVNGSEVESPLFMPVATSGDVKTLISRDLKELGVQALITNAYHLLMRPGIDIIEEHGGLHEFMNWDGVIFTDSGGFQMIRKGFDKKIEGGGVHFKSEINGEELFISPEEDIEIQKRLGSDVAMCLDYCPPYPADKEELELSVERTTNWAGRCRNVDTDIFAISQGGTDPGLRERSCRELSEIDFQGYALGGLSIGEPAQDMYRMTEIADGVFPEDKPRYLMGLGSPVDMLECIKRGVDVFDSAYPTRNARHGSVFTSGGRINIEKGRYRRDKGPIDDKCECEICENYSRAYINHLSRANEITWMKMTTIHNLHFVLKMMEDARIAIKEGRFKDFLVEFKNNYG